MRIDPIFDQAFSEIYGKPAWRVSPGWGSFMTFEFGDPHLEIREPKITKRDVDEKVKQALARRNVFIHGDWHLWINCCDWKVTSGGNVVGRSTTDSSIRKAAEFLDGQQLTRFSLTPETVHCVFEFDLGGRLETYPYDDKGEQWLFYDSRNNVLVLRADGMYSLRPSDQAVEPEWKSVWQY